MLTIEVLQLCSSWLHCAHREHGTSHKMHSYTKHTLLFKVNLIYMVSEQALSFQCQQHDTDTHKRATDGKF